MQDGEKVQELIQEGAEKKIGEYKEHNPEHKIAVKELREVIKRA